MSLPAIKRRKIDHNVDRAGINGKDTISSSFDSAEASSNDDQKLNDDTSDSNAGTDGDVGSERNISPTDVNEEEIKRMKATQSVHRQTSASGPENASMSALQDDMYTAETFKSNMFKLQVDELLQQVKPRYGKKEAPAESAVRTLKTIIEQLPSRAPVSVAEAEKTLASAGISVPFPNPRPPKDAKYKFHFERPSSINVTGSYPLRTATKADEGISLDLLVTMPREMFQEKDYQNYRYFYKRAFYLACLAAGIGEAKGNNFKTSFACLHGNQLQPIVMVRPTTGDHDGSLGLQWHINILITLPEDTFPRARLAPSANCVRPKDGNDDSIERSHVPTPFYNSTLRADANITPYLKFLHATSENCDAYREACILGRIWLKQRGFSSHLRQGGFGNFEWALLTALLLQPNQDSSSPPLSTRYSSYQLFKATLQFLVRHDLSKRPFTFNAGKIATPPTADTPVVFDGPRCLNILFKMTSWSFLSLQSEAETTIELLNGSGMDAFEPAFILKTNISSYRDDGIVELPLSALALDPASEEYEQRFSNICHKIHTTLGRALTDRITALRFTFPKDVEWPLSSRKPQESQQKVLLIHMTVNPSKSDRTVDHGPAADNKEEAASFRKFWGEKAELRRFKDGSILESVVWSVKDSPAPVLKQIVIYVLHRHISKQVAENVRIKSDSFAPLLPTGRSQTQSGNSNFLPIMNAFASLEKDIRRLDGLPLQVRHIRAADAQLRYASVEPPAGGSHQTPASAVIQFEGSARWPDDLCAIQRTKIAFLLKLSERLTSAQPSYRGRVGLENPSQPSHNQAYLDILHPSGFSFRLRVHHDREATLFDRQLQDKSLDAQSRESTAAGLALYKRDFLQVPAHTQAMQTLSTRFSALSPTIRLTKRWFAAHLLSPHFAPEVIELLVVRTFLQPYPWPIPSCATTGFLRTLAWISRWDWRHSPLLVDLSSTTFNAPPEGEASGRNTKPGELEEARTRFEAWRRIDPSLNRLVLFAATNLDSAGNTWTDRAKPEKVVAARMSALAKAASNVVRAEEDRLLARVNDGTKQHTNELAPNSLFTSQTDEYDFVIHINPKFTAQKSKKAEAKFKNVQIQHTAKPSEILPVQLTQLFADDLTHIYGDAILWFWDAESMDKIAGLWNPLVTGQRGWKIKPGWNGVPVSGKKNEGGEGGVEVRVNKDAMLNEIRRLGGELIFRVSVK